jgi:GNAT superfamily N-acetyltransferase
MQARQGDDSSMSISDIIKQEKEFSKFKMEISEPMDKSFFHMTFRDGKTYVGTIGCRSFKEYYDVLNIYLDTEYQNRGYAKFFYKSALQYAKRNGRVGLLSGKTLIQVDKINKVYKHFMNYTFYLNKTIESRRTVLTEWIEKK